MRLVVLAILIVLVGTVANLNYNSTLAPKAAISVLDICGFSKPSDVQLVYSDFHAKVYKYRHAPMSCITYNKDMNLAQDVIQGVFKDGAVVFLNETTDMDSDVYLTVIKQARAASMSVKLKTVK